MMEDSGGSFESLTSIQPKIQRLDPFWATRLWQKLVKEAKTKVKVSKQRYFLKTYEDVFKGEDLTDVVFQFLKQCNSELDVNCIERTNALKVCQVLMDKKLFESVVPKGTLRFEDGSNRLYKFVPDEPTANILNKESIAEKENRSFLYIQEKENLFSPCMNTSRVFTPDLLKRNLRRSMRIKTPLMRVKDTRPSPVRFSKRVSRDADQEALLSQRDTAFSLLLQMVDIPVLENILSVPYDLPELPESPQPFVLENDFTPRKRQPTRLEAVGPVGELQWVRAASACLGGLHPAGIACIWSAQAAKVLCYKSVTERFSCSAQSIIPGEYFSVCIPIVGMLQQEQRKQALTALQLLVLHLPWRRRKQLQQLLQFLHLVVEDLFVSIDKKITNYEAVVRDFLPVVFKHPLVSAETQKILFDYFLLKVKDIFKVPEILQQLNSSGVLFCKTISANQFEVSSASYTKKCLFSLASQVVDSTNIKLADKKAWLKKLKKHHGSVYESCNFDE